MAKKLKKIKITREYKNFQEAAEHLAIKDVFMFNQHFGIDGINSDDYQFLLQMHDINDGSEGGFKCVVNLTLKPW